MSTSIDLGKSTSLHTMESQGRSQDFPLGGANLEKGPQCPKIAILLGCLSGKFEPQKDSESEKLGAKCGT